MYDEKFNKKPPDWDNYKNSWGYKDPNTYVLDNILGIVIIALIGGVFFGFVFFVLSGARGDSSFLPFFIMGAVLAGMLFAMISINNTRADVQQQRQRNSVIENAYNNEKTEYKAELEKHEEYQRYLRRNSDIKPDPEREKREAQQRAEKEAKERREKEWQIALKKRRAEFEQNSAWARGAFEAAFQDVALHLAAEEGILDQQDVIRVFASLYPKLPIASDSRMGCLRVYIEKDARVRAIRHSLPPIDTRNTPPQ